MVLTSSLQHVEGDHGVVVQKNCLVGNDETHSTHIGGKVVYMLATLGDLQAVLQNTEINLVEFIAKLCGLHKLVIFPIGTNHITTLYK